MSFTLDASGYTEVFPAYPPVVCTGKWVYGVWMIGNYYKREHGFYGEYPPSYLKRVSSLFRGDGEILHLFSGVIAQETTFDIDESLAPDVVGNANRLSEYFPNNSFDLIFADPPYSKEDAKKYGTEKEYPNKRIVLHQCYKIAREGCYLVWLDLSIPIYKKIEWEMVGSIALLTGTNRRIRIVSIFRKAD